MRKHLLQAAMALLVLIAPSLVYSADPDKGLRSAARKGNLTKVSQLLDQGRNINSMDEKGRTALVYAAMRGHRDVVELLLNRGAKVIVKDKKITAPHRSSMALYFAIENRHAEVASLLVQHGALVYQTNVELAGTLLSENQSFIQLLHTGRANTRLRFASARSRNADLVRDLIEQGTHVDARTGNGWTALMMAAREGASANVRILLDAGADANAHNQTDWTALYLAANNGRLTMAQELLRHGAPVDAQTSEGKTALMAAVSKGHEPVIEALVAAGADKSIADNNGNTAGSLARSHYDKAKDLLERNTGTAVTRETARSGGTALLEGRYITRRTGRMVNGRMIYDDPLKILEDFLLWKGIMIILDEPLPD